MMHDMGMMRMVMTRSIDSSQEIDQIVPETDRSDERHCSSETHCRESVVHHVSSPRRYEQLDERGDSVSVVADEQLDQL